MSLRHYIGEGQVRETCGALIDQKKKWKLLEDPGEVHTCMEEYGRWESIPKISILILCILVHSRMF